ncbi:MAG: hypothetical protein ACAH83_19165 [Alphaproteobacteria bacterium]
MNKSAAKAFAAAAKPEADRIRNAIRAPDSDCLTPYYVAQKSDAVAQSLLKLARKGETEAVASFLFSNAIRFATLAEKGQINTLLDTLETLGKSQQAKVLGATESISYGAPNATVLQTLAGTPDEKVQERLAGLLRGLDSAQCTKLFSTPGAAWWMSSHERDDVMTEVISALSPKQRQYIVNHAKDMTRVIETTDREDFAALFKDCKFQKGKAPVLGRP